MSAIVLLIGSSVGPTLKGEVNINIDLGVFLMVQGKEILISSGNPLTYWLSFGCVTILAIVCLILLRLAPKLP